MVRPKLSDKSRKKSLEKASATYSETREQRIVEEEQRQRLERLETESAANDRDLKHLKTELGVERERTEKLERERDSLVARVLELEKERDAAVGRMRLLETERDGLTARVRSLEAELVDSLEDYELVAQEKAMLQEEVDVRISEATKAQKEHDDRELEQRLELVQRDLDHLIAQTPTKGKKLKAYDAILDRCTKENRFNLVLELIRRVVSQSGMDPFLRDFVSFLAKSPDYSFRFRLTPKESYYIKVRFGLSDGFLKNFKHILTESLNFDIFASRKKIDEIRNECSPLAFYSIDIEIGQRTTKSGKLVDTSTAVARMTRIEDWLIRRLETLHSHGRLLFDDGTGDDIVIAFGGDKGAETTKLCLVLENVQYPNNPHAISIIGYYTGPDNNQFLREKMGIVFEQLNRLKSVTYLERGVPKTRNVRMKLIGDCKFISAIYGHGGQSCRDPCFTCHLTWRRSGHAIDTVGNFDFERAGPPRSLSEYLATGTPLLLVEPTSAGPPGLHVLMGVGQTYVVDPLYALCNSIDYQLEELPASLKEQRRKLAERQKEADMYFSRVRGLHDAMEMVDAVDCAYQKVSGGGSIKRAGVRVCSSPFCVANMIPKKLISGKVDLLICESCEDTFHPFCIGLFKPDDVLGASRSAVKCLGCTRHQTLADHCSVLRRSRNIIRKALDNDEDVLGDVIEERDELDAHLNKCNGPTRRKLEDAFRSIGCDVRVWYQQLNGNQFRDLFRSKNIDIVLGVFPPSPEIESLRIIMTQLCFIMSQSNNSVKSDTEIEAIEVALETFSSAMRDFHHSASITPKLHMLTAHLVPFMTEHRSWGRVNEHGLENTHAVVNTESARLSSVRSVKLHAELLLKQFMNFNMISDSGDSWLQSSSD